MCLHEKRTLTIPSHKAYGTLGYYHDHDSCTHHLYSSFQVLAPWAPKFQPTQHWYLMLNLLALTARQIMKNYNVEILLHASRNSIIWIFCLICNTIHAKKCFKTSRPICYQDHYGLPVFLRLSLISSANSSLRMASRLSRSSF
jgi:hypothetical protein